MRMYDKIDLNNIFDLIDSIDIITEIRKGFYKKIKLSLNMSGFSFFY